MARQNIGIGTVADDGTGDTLRTAGQKINQNFQELYGRFGDSTAIGDKIIIASGGIVFEGAVDDINETSLIPVEPTADRTVYVPDANGTLITDSASQTMINKTLTAPIIGSGFSLRDSNSHDFKFVAGNIAANRNVNVPVLTDSDTLVFENHTQILTNKTLVTPTLNTPVVGASVDDSNNNSLISFVTTNSAVNHVSVKNNIANSDPLIQAAGTDANINLNVSGKGTGSVEVAKVAYTSIVQTSAGAVSAEHTYIIFNSGTPMSVSIADGTVTGEAKIFTNRGSGAVTVQPANFAQGSFFQLAQYDGCQAIWDGNNWYLTGNQGELTVS